MPNKLLNVPLSEIRENPVALRGVARESEDVMRLIDAVRQYGVINPISVRFRDTDKNGHKDGRLYEIIDGLHRYTAALESGLSEIPAQVLDQTEEQTQISQIIANAHKIETKPMEYTRALLRILSANPGMTEAELAAMLNMSPSFVNQRLGLQKLAENIGSLVNNGQIGLNNAFALSKLPPEVQKDWVERAIAMGPAEFGPLALTEAKRLRDSARSASQANPEVFKPLPVVRKTAELKSEFNNPQIAAVIVKENAVSDPVEAFKLGVAWALQMDPQSQKAAIERDQERKKKAAEDKAKREAERAKAANEDPNKVQKELIDAAGASPTVAAAVA